MRKINDPVKVRFFGTISLGTITDIGGHGKILYQVKLDGPAKTQLWFGDDEVMDR